MLNLQNLNAKVSACISSVKGDEHYSTSDNVAIVVWWLNSFHYGYYFIPLVSALLVQYINAIE